MPPNPPTVPLPEGEGISALKYLEAHGLMARIPSIRSRDFSTINSCRRLYYLIRRLGLTRALSHSSSLSRGSWAHNRLEAFRLSPGAADDHRLTVLKKRHLEIAATCKTLGISDTARLEAQEIETHDSLTAHSWFNAACTFTLPQSPYLAQGILGYLNSPKLRCLGTEILLKYNHPNYPKTPLVIQIDILFYAPETNRLIILDLKTHTGSTLDRIRRAPLEHQTRHYLYVMGEFLKTGILQRQYDLPTDVRLGGMAHLVIQKPQIELCGKDRHYQWASESKRSNLRMTARPAGKGKWHLNKHALDDSMAAIQTDFPGTEEQIQAYLKEQVGTIAKKEYYGEPDPTLYVDRLRQWYNGTGDYADLRPKIEADPPVNISFTAYDLMLDSIILDQYTTKLNRVYHYATCPALPHNFDPEPEGAMSGRELSPYAPFYLEEVKLWPAIIARDKFIQSEDAEAPSVSN